MFDFIQYNESSTYYFYSTAAQCVAGVAGLSAALSTFHYQNLLGRIREKRDGLYDKYHPLIAGLKKGYLDQYNQCRSIEESIDFWKGYFQKEAKGSEQHKELSELYDIIKQTRRFRFLVMRTSGYGFVLLLPLGILGTLFPSLPWLNPPAHFILKAAYSGLLALYFLMNLSLTRSVFVNPWAKK